MVQYSIAVQLAWEISSYEAANKKSPLIEIDHIMLGVLSLDKIKDQSQVKTNINFQNFIFEKEKLYEILNSNNIQVSHMRRGLRCLLQEGENTSVEKNYHRSIECKQMFRAAEVIASNFLTINHLFHAIITFDSSLARKFLISEKIDLDKLKSQIMFSFYKNN